LTECLWPYPKPERARDKKERHSAEGLSNSGNRLQPLGTREEEVARRTLSVKLPVTEGGAMVEKSTGLREASGFGNEAGCLNRTSHHIVTACVRKDAGRDYLPALLKSSDVFLLRP
jgi:hypothetical protein